MKLTSSAKLALAFAVVAAPFAGHSIVWRHDVGDAAYVNYGNQFNNVGFIGSNTASGSATLISQNWILTAWHVVEGNTNAANWQFNLNGTNYGVDQIHLRAAAGSNFGTVANNGQDLALMRLTTNITNVTPAQLYTGTSELGLTGNMVGFGLNGSGLTTSAGRTFDGQRRAADNVLDRWATLSGNSISWGTTRTRLLLTDFDNPAGNTNVFGSGTALALEGNVDSGDSGGALFITVGGNRFLAGVTSFKGGDGNYGSLSGFNTVSDELNWIQTTSGVPEPATMTILALAALAKKRKAKKNS